MTEPPRCGWAWISADHSTVTGSMSHVCSRDPGHDAGAALLDHVCSCGAQAQSRAPEA